MARIAVRGRAQREVLPERARVLLSVSVTGDNRTDVVTEAQRVHAAIVQQATRLVAEGKASDWTALEVQAGAYQEWIPLVGQPGQQEQVRRFRAGGDIQIEFSDFDEMGRWLGSVAELSGVEVRGIDWRLTEATRSEVAANIRAEAVRDAVQRALDYSTSLGLDELSLKALYEPGLYRGEYGGTGQMPMARPAMLAFGESTAMGGQGFELKPAIVPVTAEITAIFKTARS